MSLIEAYEAGRLGYIRGHTNPYPVTKTQRAEAGAWECGWLDAQRAGAGHTDTVQRIRGEEIK